MKYKSVDELLKSSLSEAQNRVAIYNPLFDPFSIEYDGEEYTVEPQAITKLPNNVAKNMVKHLRDKIINDRGYSGSIYEERKRVESEILI